MKKKLLFVTLFLLITLCINKSIYSQKDTIPIADEVQQKEIKKLKISNLSVHAGFQNRYASQITAADFNKLAPGSTVLSDDFAEYSNYYNHNTSESYDNYTNVHINMGIEFGNKKKASYRSNPLLRIGFGFTTGNLLSDEYYNETRIPFDTLTSNSTGETVYVDSLFTNYNKLDYRVTIAGINASLIFRTNPKARFSFYSGIGFGVGISTEKETMIYHDERSDKSFELSNGQTFDQYQYPFYDVFEIETVSSTSSPIMNYSIYIPAGVNFRIRKDHDIWKKVCLSVELTPGINITSIPELGTKTKQYIQIGIGALYNFN
jgi:hypothetical protein